MEIIVTLLMICVILISFILKMRNKLNEARKIFYSQETEIKNLRLALKHADDLHIKMMRERI